MKHIHNWVDKKVFTCDKGEKTTLFKIRTGKNEFNLVAGRKYWIGIDKGIWEESCDCEYAIKFLEANLLKK